VAEKLGLTWRALQRKRGSRDRRRSPGACGVSTKGWWLRKAREEATIGMSARRGARIPLRGTVGQSWAAARRSTRIFAENPLGALPEGAPENIFDVYWRPYGNGFDTMLNIL
jgi:hypothetical protein